MKQYSCNVFCLMASWHVARMRLTSGLWTCPPSLALPWHWAHLWWHHCLSTSMGFSVSSNMWCSDLDRSNGGEQPTWHGIPRVFWPDIKEWVFFKNWSSGIFSTTSVQCVLVFGVFARFWNIGNLNWALSAFHLVANFMKYARKWAHRGILSSLFLWLWSFWSAFAVQSLMLLQRSSALLWA